MDSMRSLNTSLPRTSPQRKTQQQQQPQAPQPQQPEDILSAFKAAALSVTQLYKSAASLQAPARAAGYQEALNDLLAFLDKEDLGLCDGEGWQVRQWATERLDGSSMENHDGEEEEEENERHEDDRVENGPADTGGKGSTQEEDLSSSVDLAAGETEPKPDQSPRIEHRHISPSLTSNMAFTFRSPHHFPTNHERDANMDGISGHSQSGTSSTNNASPKSDVPHRQPRVRQQRSGPQRPGTSLRTTLSGPGAGSKRKFPLGDFFDLSGINFDSKDGFDRGGKRSRHV